MNHLAMRNIKLLFVVLAIVLSGCVQFKTATLYDGQETEPPSVPPSDISLAVEPIIFKDDATNFWVSDDPNCTTGGPTTEAVHSGDKALKINWDRNKKGCTWAGFGIGWDDWAGKDLSDVYDHAAVEFYVRAQKGKMFGLPVVLSFEDYSGHSAWSYTGNKYFERYFIDEEWQKVVVPLNTFDLEEDGLDIGNIKQIQFELQQSGGIYLDDVKLVYYTPVPVKPWLAEAPRPDPLAFPIQLFDDKFINDNGWGILTDHCQNIQLTNSTKAEGGKSIHAKWDKSKADCYQVALGVSWNKWFPVDMSKVAATTMIELDIRTGGQSLKELPVYVGFEDYDRQLSLVQLKADFVDGGTYDSEWKRVRIPLNNIKGKANFGKIKQLMIRMENDGDVYIDNIRLVRNAG